MDKEKLKELSTEELVKKEKSIKFMMGLFVPTIIALLYFNTRDYMAGEVDMPMSIISICSIGGLVASFPELKNVQKELQKRS